MVTLRQLEIFVEVVRSGSFRRCGEHLGMSQVAVSEHVRALESQWGVSLFERRAGTAPVLTAQGAMAYERVAVILGDIADLARDIAPATRRNKRSLAVAIHPFLMRNLQSTLTAFEASHNLSLNIDLDVHWPEQLQERVERRDLDLAYFFAFSDDDVPQSHFIRTESLSIFVGPDHPLASRDSVTLAELAREPIVQMTARAPFHAMVERAFMERGITERQIGLETDEFGLIVSTLHSTRSYACLFSADADQAGRVMGLVPVKLDQELPPLQVRRLSRRAATWDQMIIDLTAAIEKRWATSNV